MDPRYIYYRMAVDLREFDLKCTKHPDYPKLPKWAVTWRKSWVKRMDLLKNKI